MKLIIRGKKSVGLFTPSLIRKIKSEMTILEVSQVYEDLMELLSENLDIPQQHLSGAPKHLKVITIQNLLNFLSNFNGIFVQITSLHDRIVNIILPFQSVKRVSKGDNSETLSQLIQEKRNNWKVLTRLLDIIQEFCSGEFFLKSFLVFNKNFFSGTHVLSIILCNFLV